MMKKVYQKCLWISYITLGIAVKESGKKTLTTILTQTSST